MIKSSFNPNLCKSGTKELYDHYIVNWRDIKKQGVVTGTRFITGMDWMYSYEDENGNTVTEPQYTSYLIDCLGYFERPLGLNQMDEYYDLCESHLVQTESSPLFGGTLYPRIATYIAE